MAPSSWNIMGPLFAEKPFHLISNPSETIFKVFVETKDFGTNDVCVHLIRANVVGKYMFLFKPGWGPSLGSLSIFYLFTITFLLNKKGSVKLEQNGDLTFSLEAF